jgi:S1-C subfamily serine protease
VRVGDRFRKVNGIVVKDLEDAQRGIYGLQVGDALDLEVERGGKKLALKVVLAELPKAAR